MPVGGLALTVSIGVARTPGRARLDYDALFAEADAALLRAKREGRVRVVRSGDEVPDRTTTSSL